MYTLYILFATYVYAPHDNDTNRLWMQRRRFSSDVSRDIGVNGWNLLLTPHFRKYQRRRP
jgi:hypothetical protein